MNAKEQILKELESRRQHYVDELTGRPQHDDEYRWLKGKHDECIDMSVYIIHHVKDEDTEPVENNLVDIRKETINGRLMTTEEKAKAYDEALERARKAYNAIPPESRGARKIIEDAFPELRESEDEKIRRTLVEYFGPSAQLDLVRGVPIQKIRDWLEKQKEQPRTRQGLRESPN